MWSIVVGLAIGVLQVLALSKLGKMILGEIPIAKAVGAFLLIMKIAAIVLILYLIATVSLTHLIWAAVGMLVGLTAAFTVMIARRRTKALSKNQNDGKDKGHV